MESPRFAPGAFVLMEVLFYWKSGAGWVVA